MWLRDFGASSPQLRPGGVLALGFSRQSITAMIVSVWFGSKVAHGTGLMLVKPFDAERRAGTKAGDGIVRVPLGLPAVIYP